MSRTDSHTPIEVEKARAIRKHQRPEEDLPRDWYATEYPKHFDRRAGDHWLAQVSAKRRERRQGLTVAQELRLM